MKHATPDSMKFKKLQRRLGVPRVMVVGILELLWIAVQKNAKRGDIGRHSNEEIAIECDWEGDPDVLVDALAETGWLDPCGVNRLVVHDWPEHAPRYIHAWIKSQQTTFAVPVREPENVPVCEPTPVATTEPTTEATTVPTTVATVEHPIPNLTKPNQTKPNRRESADRGRYDSQFEEFWSVFPKTRRSKKQEAYRKWKLAVRRVDAALLTSKAAEYADSPQGRSKFAVMPSTWLNGGMWEDEPEAWSAGDDDRPVSGTPQRKGIAW